MIGGFDMVPKWFWNLMWVLAGMESVGIVLRAIKGFIWLIHQFKAH
jgi:hypothetical protein